MKQLLLIDDEIQVVQALKREITLADPDRDYEIHCFTQPNSALEHIESNGSSVFLVITDLRMSQMKGDEFLSVMRETHKDINAVLLTAYADLENIQKAVQNSLQSFLMKPWTTESLLHEIQKASTSWELRKENQELRSKIDQLLADAGDFQKRLFATSIPRFVSGALSVAYEPMDRYGCGGDFFEIIAVSSGYCILLGDVSGHGPKSAIAAGMVKSLIHMLNRNKSWKFTSPELLMEDLNSELNSVLNGAPDVLVSMIAVYLNARTKEMVICNAGQPPALFYNEDKIVEVGSVQPPLAASSDRIYTKNTFNYSSDSRLYLFTDGLHESSSDKTSGVSMQDIIAKSIVDQFSKNQINFGSAHELIETIKTRAGIGVMQDDLSFICISPGEIGSE